LEELQKAAVEEMGDLPAGWTDSPMDKAAHDYYNHLLSILAEEEGRRPMNERPTPSGNGKPPELHTIIKHPVQFKDGSRIRIVVEALKGHGFDQATGAYYDMLLPVLDEIEFPDD
jgi:hypothetical protein